MRKVTLLLCLLCLIGVHSSYSQMTIEITNPVEAARYADCSDITLSANITITSGEIKDVRYYEWGRYIGRARTEPWDYEWKEVVPGYYEIIAKVTDNDKNEYFSDPVHIMVGSLANGDLCRNGEFNCSIKPWTLSSTAPAAATVSIDANAWLSDSTAAVIEVSEGGTETWHVQFLQSLPILAGHTYQVSFIADVPEEKAIQVTFQENGDDWTYWGGFDIVLDGFNVYGPFEFVAGEDDPNCAVKFCVGLNTTTLFLDGVEIIDPQVTAVEDRNSVGSPESYIMSHNYPNPFNPNTTIHYQLPQAADVRLEIFNMMGQKIHTLVDEHQSAGAHEVAWHGTDQKLSSVPSGVYIYHLTAQATDQTYTLSRKMLLIE